MRKALEAVPETVVGTDRIGRTLISSKNYNINLYKEATPTPDTKLTYFVDGAKSKTGTAAGIYSPDANLRYFIPLGSMTSVFQAEAIGILAAAQEADTFCNRQITIYSDSASVLMALKKAETTSALIRDVHVALTKLAQHSEITLQWVASHSDTEGNNIADELARAGARTLQNGPEPFVKLSSREVRDRLCKYTIKQQDKRWSVNSDCQQTKKLIRAHNRKLTRYLIRQGRQNLRLLVGVITGHCHLNKHLFRLGATDTPVCRGCLTEEETADHYLVGCQSTKDIRERVFGDPANIYHGVVQEPARLLLYLEETGWLA